MKIILSAGLVLAVGFSGCGKEQPAPVKVAANKAASKSKPEQAAPEKKGKKPAPVKKYRPDVDVSTAKEARLSLGLGLIYLLAAQHQDGSWSGHPGVTAMCIISLHKSPGRNYAEVKAAIARALEYVRGRIAGGGGVKRARQEEDIYSASVCLMAFSMLDQREDQELIRRMHHYLVRSQISKSAGFGYGGGDRGPRTTRYPDLSNTHWALEAIHLSHPQLKDAEAVTRLRRLWRQSREFISSCQVKGSRDQKLEGGFLYYPVAKQPKKPRHEKTTVVWGSLTLGALKSLVYAKVKPGDVRIKAGLGWVSRNYTLERNPGLDQGGLYYYYYMYASAMRLLACKRVPDAQGRTRNWRKELIEKLINCQRGEGEWRNPNRLWLESDAALCTAYAMLALEMALPH